MACTCGFFLLEFLLSYDCIVHGSCYTRCTSSESHSSCALESAFTTHALLLLLMGFLVFHCAGVLYEAVVCWLPVQRCTSDRLASVCCLHAQCTVNCCQLAYCCSSGGVDGGTFSYAEFAHGLFLQTNEQSRFVCPGQQGRTTCCLRSIQGCKVVRCQLTCQHAGYAQPCRSLQIESPISSRFYRAATTSAHHLTRTSRS